MEDRMMDKETREALELTKDDLLRMASEGTPADLASGPIRIPTDLSSIRLSGKFQTEQPIPIRGRGVTIQN